VTTPTTIEALDSSGPGGMSISDIVLSNDWQMRDEGITNPKGLGRLYPQHP
jgi:hypothetical protein